MPDRVNLFAYGTLQIPEVMEAVTGARFPSELAELIDYACCRIAGCPYPGLRPRPGAVTEGLLYRGIDQRTLGLLDAFEDDFYRRETRLVTTASGSRVAAEVYLVPPQHHALLIDRPWDLAAFRRRALPGFLARARRRR